MTRKALGRGLSALLREPEIPAQGLEQLPIDQIKPNPFQPRRNFAEEGLRELAESIRTSGIVQPLVVRPAQGVYQLVAGERRWRASKLAGLETVPAIVRELDDRLALELALTENLLREDLNPMEVASAYQALQTEFGLSQEEIAQRVGISRVAVTNTLRLLKLSPEIQQLIREAKITSGHARALLTMYDPEAQARLANAIAELGLSVREVENLAAIEDVRPKKAKSEATTQAEPDPNLQSAILELERTLGTKVKITGGNGRGKIEIQYYSLEDLNRIYSWITRSD